MKNLNLVALVLIGTFTFFAGCDPNAPIAEKKENPLVWELENGERNTRGFNRASGMLADVLRHSKTKSDEIQIFLKVEELINEASLMASEAQYDESFIKLQTAYKLLEN